MVVLWYKLYCTLLVVVTVISISESTSLSLLEQKKYKKLTDGQGLYSSKDDVEILTAENFKTIIYGNHRAWLVEFYNSWCGFCQRFAPSWKALASDVRHWRDVVGIGAIDCADDNNNPICREFEIMAYPTLKYFHENYKEDPKQLGVKILLSSDVKEHKQKLLEMIVTEQKEGRGKNYPIMTPYVHPDLSGLFQLRDNKVKFGFLFIQEPADFMGQEIAMDLHKIKSLVIRYSFNENSELMGLLKTTNSPVLIAVDRTYNFHIINVNSSSKDAYRNAIREFLKPNYILLPENKGKWKDLEPPDDISTYIHEQERIALKEKVKTMGDVVFQLDLETALRHSLKYEVASVKEISGEKLQSLKSYLNVLVTFFPFGKFGQLFLIELRDFVGSRTTVNGDYIAEMVNNAERDERQIFSSPPNWLACKGSTLERRGYPCGLWKLFHYLTVNAADHSMDMVGSNPKIVLEAMHGYIKHFFGCEDCSKHFQHMAKKRDIFDVTSWDDSILWLWMAHNEVNNRLSGDSIEDPEYPKYQFPSKDRCPRCHNSDNSWSFPEVLRYLKHMYSSINVKYIGSDTRILHLGLNGSVVSTYESSILKTIDTGMCFTLYVASFLLIIGLIRMFLKRGYRKKKYHNLLGKV